MKWIYLDIVTAMSHEITKGIAWQWGYFVGAWELLSSVAEWGPEIDRSRSAAQKRWLYGGARCAPYFSLVNRYQRSVWSMITRFKTISLRLNLHGTTTIEFQRQFILRLTCRLCWSRSGWSLWGLGLGLGSVSSVQNQSDIDRNKTFTTESTYTWSMSCLYVNPVSEV